VSTSLEREQTEATDDAALTEIPHSDAHVFDLQDVKQRVDAIHRIMAQQMKPNVHYGVIPGTKKPTLYKPGSEILLLTFRVAIDPEITDLSTADEIRYRIRAVGRHVPTGLFMGAGVGECSSKEEKFLWRAALSREEYDDTPEDQRRIKYKKERDRGRPMTVKVEQIKVPPPDAANAVLKRAKKRAQVDFCLTAMAASEIFTQDVEDLPDGYLNEDDKGAAPSDEPTITKEQVKQLQGWHSKLRNDRKGPAVAVFNDRYGVTSLEELPARKFEDALAWYKLAAQKESKGASRG